MLLLHLWRADLQPRLTWHPSHSLKVCPWLTCLPVLDGINKIALKIRIIKNYFRRIKQRMLRRLNFSNLAVTVRFLQLAINSSNCPWMELLPCQLAKRTILEWSPVPWARASRSQTGLRSWLQMQRARSILLSHLSPSALHAEWQAASNTQSRVAWFWRMNQTLTITILPWTDSSLAEWERICNPSLKQFRKMNNTCSNLEKSNLRLTKRIFQELWTTHQPTVVLLWSLKAPAVQQALKTREVWLQLPNTQTSLVANLL